MREEILKLAKEMMEKDPSLTEWILTKFPELRESEDERIREAILWCIRTVELELGCKYIEGFSAAELKSWLKKKGKNNMGISEATKQKLEDNLNKALEKETPESWNEFLDERNSVNKVEREGMNIVEENMTPFQKKVFCIIDTTIEEEQGLKQVCDELLRLAHDEIMQNPDWSEEDEDLLKWTINNLTELEQRFGKDYGKVGECINWIKQKRWKKSLKTADLENSLCDIQDGYSDTSHEYRVLGEAIEFIRSTDPWKPSKEQLSALHDAAIYIKDSMFPYPKDILMNLYEQLKNQNHEI